MLYDKSPGRTQRVPLYRLETVIDGN